MIAATLACMSDSDWNDTSAGAWVDTNMNPVSSLGKNPFGMTM